MVSIETVSIVFTALSVHLAAFYYISTLRNTRRNQELQLETRQLQLYTTVFQPGQSREWLNSLIDVIYNQEWEDYEDYRRKYGPESNPDAYIAMIQAIELFTMIGLYVEQKALDLDMVIRHNGRVAMRLWEKVESFVKGHRERTGNPMHWYSFEYLYEEMKKYYSQDHSE
jgi:hypothetical protein